MTWTSEKDVTVIIEKALNNQSDCISLRMKHKLNTRDATYISQL